MVLPTAHSTPQPTPADTAPPALNGAKPHSPALRCFKPQSPALRGLKPQSPLLRDTTALRVSYTNFMVLNVCNSLFITSKFINRYISYTITLTICTDNQSMATCN